MIWVVLFFYILIGILLLITGLSRDLDADTMLEGEVEGAIGRAAAWPVLLVIAIVKALIYVFVVSCRAVMRAIVG